MQRQGFRGQILLLIFVGAIGIGSQPAQAARFTDLSGNWSEKYINSLSDSGIISAEPNGQFQPDAPVTRAILAAWMVKVLGLQNQPVSSTPSFKDVKPTDWFYKPVEILRQSNYISAYADGFRPNSFIQKAEAIVIVSRALNKGEPNEANIQSVLARFKDGDTVPAWARAGVAQAAMAGILDNQPNAGVVDATKIATRGDAATLLYQLSEYLGKQSIARKLKNVNAGPGQAAAWGQPPMYSPPQNYRQPPSQYQSSVPDAYGQPTPQDNNTDQFNTSFRANTGGPQYGNYYPQTGNFQGGYPPRGMRPNGYGNPILQGRVAVIEAGRQFEGKLRNTIDSGSTQPGEVVEATLSEPIYSGNVEVIPAGSRVLGQVTNVVSARRFRFGANGKVDIKFTEIQTPDGRRFPLSASVDSNRISLSGGTTAGRVGKGLATAGVGAASGALLGTALGAIVGGTAGGPVGRSTAMGAVFGTALGGGIGVVGAGVRKGSEVKITAGSELPIQLDGDLQISSGNSYPAMQPQYMRPVNNAPYQGRPTYQYQDGDGDQDNSY